MRKHIAGIVLLLLIICFASCGAKQTQQQADCFYGFTDHLGNTVVLDKKPEKVAVLFSSFADIWKSAGGNVAVTVGESIERGFADKDAVLVDSGAGKTVNTELLIAESPDLVICSADIPEQVKSADILRKANIPTACFSVESFEDYLEVLKIFTDITENKSAYKLCGTDVGDDIEQILEFVPKDSHTDVLFIRAGSTASSTKAKNAEQHFAAAMISELGANNIADNAPVLLDGLSIEEILISQPEIIFISTMGDEKAAVGNIELMFSEKTWQSVDAVKNGRYYFLPKELFQYKPNSRWAEAYEYLAELIYD